MSGLLSRFTTFLPNTTILSNDHNQEFNQIVQLLNGTTTNLKTVLKTSDTGDSPLELDQLSTGPIAKFFQGGILKASVTNDGSFSSTANLLLSGNIQISNTAPEVKFIDTNNSKQVRIALDNTAWNFLNDTLATVPLTINTTNDLATFSGVVSINSVAPELRWVDTNNSKQMRIALDNTLWNWINDTLASTPLSMNTTSDVFTFSQIPVFPAANPTTDNQGARKAFVDSRRTAFSLPFFIQDPSTPTLDATISGIPAYIVPEGVNITITKILVLFKTGSHTGGGDVTFSVFRRLADGSGGATIASIHLDNTNNTAFVVYQNDIGDVTLNQRDSLDCFVDNRSGTITERDVSVVLIGTQTLG